MTAVQFSTLPASTSLTTAIAGAGRGSIGLTVVEGELCISIAEGGGSRVMVARLHQSVLDEFCGLLADHLPSIAPDSVAAAHLENGKCTTKH